jgi:hypothetical protein
MFKKTLIATAVVATTATFGAAASTVTSTPSTVGVEYAVGKAQMTAADVTVVPGRDYDSGDIIIVTFAGATVATMTDAATPVAIVPTLTTAGALVSNVEFLAYDGNSVQLLVTNPVSFEAAGTSLTLSGVQLITTAAADKGKVTVSALGKVDTVLGAKDVDPSKSVTTITYASQLSSKIESKFDAVVDVNAARKAFVGGGTSDQLVLSNTVAAVDTGFGVTTTGAVYTVKGDFSFLDVDGDGKLEAKEGYISSDGGTVKVAADMMSATITSVATVSTGTVGINVVGATGVVIPDQEFTASTVLNYAKPSGATGNLSVTTLAESAAGSWTLNGAKAHIPFLPYGSNYAQSVTVSNTSVQTGGVDLTIYVGDDTVDVEGIATIEAEGVTDISSAIASAVADAGLASGNYAFDIVVNAPEDAISVTAVYYAKSDGDRVRTK